MNQAEWYNNTLLTSTYRALTRESVWFTVAQTRGTKAVTFATATTRLVMELTVIKYAAHQPGQDTITIYDATNKVGNTTNIISITTFPGAQYIHQG